VRIGIGTDDHGRLIGASGKSSANLYALGPLRKATLWETTAVPEIREQALELAERIVSELSENGVRKLNGVARSMAAGKTWKQKGERGKHYSALSHDCGLLTGGYSQP